MSKEIIRQIASKRFAAWQGLTDSLKSYPNMPDKKPPRTGQWAKLKIEHVLRKVTSIGSSPCTARTGVLVIEVYERLDVGTKAITELTDGLEQWFSFYREGALELGAAYTVDDINKDKAYYLSIVYVPFRYN